MDHGAQESLPVPTAPHIAERGGLTVEIGTRNLLADMILTKHYAQRMPPVSYAYAMRRDGNLIGGLTIGKPASRPLCVGLAGEKYAPNVYELNRLITDGTTDKNDLSWFVGASLRDLSSERIVLVSFADAGAGHHGYIYQATNWVYTGVSPGRTDKYMPGGKHPRHYTEEYAHLRKIRTAKHRYVFVPNKRFRKEIMREMNYPVMPYPKGANDRYTLGARIIDKVLDTRTGIIYDDSPSLLAIP